MSVRKAIIQLIEQEIVITAPITDTTNLYEDLHLDSLSFVSLLMDIEDRYGITFELGEMEGCHIAGQLIELVEQKVKEVRTND